MYVNSCDENLYKIGIPYVLWPHLQIAYNLYASEFLPTFSPKEPSYQELNFHVIYLYIIFSAGSLLSCHGKAYFPKTWAYQGWESEGMHISIHLWWNTFYMIRHHTIILTGLQKKQKIKTIWPVPVYDI